MSRNDRLRRFGTYQAVCGLFDLSACKLSRLARNPLGGRLASQPMASADSIAVNVEEGYGRGRRNNSCHSLVIARGSATETRDQLAHRVIHWLPAETSRDCAARREEIVAIGSASIDRLRFEP